MTELEAQLDAAHREGLVPNMRRWLRFVGLGPQDVLELQALDVPQPRGPSANLFAHAQSSVAALKLLFEAERWQHPAPALYQILNRIDPRVAARAEPGKWHRFGKVGGSTDRDIIERRVLPIDLDVVRPRGTSTSDAEMQLSVDVALAVHARMVSAVGADAVAYGHSGNGRWCAVALAVPATDETREIVRVVLEALGVLHGTQQVHIDAAVSDAKRLGPAWGTTKRKGASTAERPHRVTGILVPEGEAKRLGLDELRDLAKTLAAEAKLDQPKTRTIMAGTAPALRETPLRQVSANSAFAAANAQPIGEVADRLGIERLARDFVRCPGCGAEDAKLLARGLMCHHDSCARRGKPGRPGFRTPVDLVAEVRSCSAAEAVTWLATSFNFTVAEAKRPKIKTTSSAAVQIEIDAARRLIERFGGDLRYAAGVGWLRWTGTHWSRDSAEVSRELVKRVVEELRVEAARDNDDDLWKLTQRLGTARGITALLDAARSDPRVRIHAVDLDSTACLLAVENGTVDLKTGELRAHERGDLLTRCTPTRYDPDAKHEPLARLLEHLVPDAEARAYLQRAVGYSLTGVVSEDVIFLLVGAPRCGKGTLLRALGEALGEHFTAAAMRSFCVSKYLGGGNQARSDLYRLLGRRIVAASEIHPGLEFDTGLLKGLAGGDKLPVRDLREKEVEARVTFTMWLVANDGDLPRMRPEDDALWERVRRIPVGSTVPEAERDAAFREGFSSSEARAAVLAWAVAGAVAWFAGGLGTPPAEVRAASSALRETMDPVAEFAAEALVFDANAVETRVALREAFEAFSEGEQRVMSAKLFAKRLVALAWGSAGVALTKTSKREGVKVLRAWRGVRFATTIEREQREGSNVLTYSRSHVATCSQKITYESSRARKRVLADNEGTSGIRAHNDTAGDAYEPSAEDDLAPGAEDFDPSSFEDPTGGDHF